MIPLTASTHPFTPASLKELGGSSPPQILVHVPDYAEREMIYTTLAAEGHVYHNEKAQRDEALIACGIAYDVEMADEISAFLKGVWQQLDNDIKAATELNRRLYPLPPEEREKEAKAFYKENPRELTDEDAARHDKIMAHLRKCHAPLKRMVLDNMKFQLATAEITVKRVVKGWRNLPTAQPELDDVDEGMSPASLNRLRGALNSKSQTAYQELTDYLSSLMVLDADELGNFVSPLSTDSTPESSKAATGKEAAKAS